jgi:hypothetical protein
MSAMVCDLCMRLHEGPLWFLQHALRTSTKATSQQCSAWCARISC